MALLKKHKNKKNRLGKNTGINMAARHPFMQIFIIHDKINKTPNGIIENFELQVEDDKTVLFRFNEITELSDKGMDNFLGLLQHCFIRKLSVIITELTTSLITQLPHMPVVEYYASFDEALESVNVQL